MIKDQDVDLKFANSLIATLLKDSDIFKLK